MIGSRIGPRHPDDLRAEWKIPVIKSKMRNNLLLVLQRLTLRVWSGLLTMVAFRTIVAY
jgi:hypothetical protein